MNKNDFRLSRRRVKTQMSDLEESRAAEAVEDFIEDTFDPLLERHLRFNKGKQFTMRFSILDERTADVFHDLLSEALKIAPTKDRYKGLTFSSPAEITKTGYTGNPQCPYRDVTIGYDVDVTIET